MLIDGYGFRALFFLNITILANIHITCMHQFFKISRHFKGNICIANPG